MTEFDFVRDRIADAVLLAYPDQTGLADTPQRLSTSLNVWSHYHEADGI